MGRIKRFLQSLISHPNFTCDVCGREVFAGEKICSACMAEMPFNRGNICTLCGRKSRHGGYCMDCRAKLPKYDMARSVFVHEKDAQKLILRFKHGEKYLCATLADFLEQTLSEFPPIDVVCYVPMTERAIRRRGYNQSRLLAEEISGRSGIALFDGIRKIAQTKEQKELGFRERRENVKNSFDVVDRAQIRDKQVLLLDDVMTTGATCDEIAGCLKRAGARKVFVLTVSSVPDPSM